MPKQTDGKRNFPTDDQITRLTDAVVSLDGQIEDLAEFAGAVLTLTEQVRCLRLAVDEIEQELGWAIRAKVLDRLPRPQFPCDERLPLVSPGEEPIKEATDRMEHVCDEPTGEPLVPLGSSDATLPEIPPSRRRQRGLW
jgi:hypothetical protein